MSMQDDQHLAYAVERALEMLPSVNHNEVKVSVDRGRARLVGIIMQGEDKEALLQAVRSVPGIVAVDDAIAVETPDPSARAV